ncbi:MAG: RING finger domain-containing protein [Candidatus Hodarchaeota archaeon]
MPDGFILILFVLFVLILMFNYQTKTSKTIKQAERAQTEGRMRQAADLFIKSKKYVQAAKIALALPEAERTGIIQNISVVLSPSKKKTLFTKLGDEYATNKNFVKAATAFELAGTPLRAARYFVLADSGLVKRGLRLVIGFAQAHPNLKVEDELRNLARFAFQNEKYIATAEILEFLGAREEADAVLVFAAEEYEKSEHIEGAIEAYARAGKDSKAITLSIKTAQQMLKMNQLEKALNHFKRAYELAKELNLAQEQKEAENALTATSQLVEARQHLKNGRYKDAADLYTHALQSLTKISTFPESLLAEAALAHEKSGANEQASSLYAEAAKKTPNKKLAARFHEKARVLKEKPEIKPSPIREEEQQCIICRRTFKSTDKVVRCPYCYAAAHYAHFAEWIKINGKCPVCKRRLKRVELIQ